MRSIVAALVLAASIAHAQSFADEQIAHGLEARQRGDDAEGARCFQAAYEDTPSGRALAQWALAEQALGRWPEAEAHLAAALREDDAWIVEHRVVLEGALETIRAQLGSLEVECTPVGAAILVDGRHVGRAPLAEPLRVRAGTVVIEVAAEGFYSVRRVLEVRARTARRETITLVAMATEPSVPARAPPIAAPPSTQAPAAASWELVLGWTVIATAGAGLIGSAIAWGIREHELSLWNDDARCMRVLGLSRDEECPGEGQRWRTAEAIAITSLVASLSSLVLGTVLLVVDAARGEPQHAFRCAPGGCAIAF